MQLSDGEKLILAMLCEIYGHLKIKHEIDPTFVMEAIYSGNTWALKEQYRGIFTDDASDTVVHEVTGILQMWWVIEASYQKLSPEDKARIEAEAAPVGRYVAFRGFDGNEETEYMSVARFLVEKLDRFVEFKGRDFNAHMPSLETNRRMLKAFAAVRDSYSLGELLTASQIIQILKEKLALEDQ